MSTFTLSVATNAAYIDEAEFEIDIDGTPTTVLAGYKNSGSGTKTATAGTVGADVLVYGTDFGLYLDNGPWTLNVDGIVGSANGTAIRLADPGVDKTLGALSAITLKGEADVYGGQIGIETNHATNITNAVGIGGGIIGIVYSGDEDSSLAFTVNNAATGAINGGIFGLVIDDTFTGTQTITNAGQMVGYGSAEATLDVLVDPDVLDGAAIYAMYGSFGAQKVTNSGTLGDSLTMSGGNVYLYGGNDSFTNSGTVYGNVSLGYTGTKRLDDESNEVSGGDGDDTFVNSGTIWGNVILGNGVVNSASSTGIIYGTLTGGSGVDTFTSSKQLGNDLDEESSTVGETVLDLGSGTSNKATLGGVVYGDILGGSGDDSITSTATIYGSVTLGNGITNSLSATGAVYGSVSSGSSNDTISSTKQLGINAADPDGTLGTDVLTLGNGDNTVTLGGVVYGNVVGGAGTDKVTSSATIYGNVALGGSASTNLLNATGAVLGVVTTGAAADTVTSTKQLGVNAVGEDPGTIGSTVLDLGSGDNIATLGGLVYGDVVSTSGLDKVTTSATHYGDIDLGNGNNTFAATGIVFGSVTLGLGDDIVSSTKQLGEEGNARDAAVLILGGATTKNTATLGGVVHGAVEGSDAIDIVTSSATIKGNVSLGEGANQLTATGDIQGLVTVGAGADKISSTKVLGINATIENGGTLDDTVLSLGAGANAVTLGGLVYGNILAGADKDTITNSGTIYGKVTTAESDDTVTMSGAGRATGLVDLGDGNDKFTGGTLNDVVADGNGKDTVLLGAGEIDVYVATGASGTDDTDTIDGGAGLKDVYDASGATTGGVFINLDTVAHAHNYSEESSLALAAGTAYGADVSGSADPEAEGFKTDKILGFEAAIGGTMDDVIFGSAAVNNLEGGEGADILYGYAGNDTLKGGDGADIIIGGAGKDLLYGDAGADQFMYLLASDSGATAATRDRIYGFDAAEDVINLSSLPVFEDLTFASNMLFEDGPTIRAVRTSYGTLVQGDLNGDKKAEFTIELYGFTGTLTATNFGLA